MLRRAPLNRTARLFFCAVVLLSGVTDAAALQPPKPHHTTLLGPKALLVRLGLQIRRTSLDCSHLVHYLYHRAGLYYTYANSVSIYEGETDFKRVFHPRAGDLITWRGHVGIVVDPQKHSFLSALRSGVKLADYNSPYWSAKGRPRFFRYPTPRNVVQIPKTEDSFNDGDDVTAASN